jgi:hypothetical protein
MNMAINKINNELGNLRRSTVVMTFGPGSLVDFRAERAPVSAVVAGLEEWDSSFRPPGLANSQTVFEPRLQQQLGVAGFRLPPVVDESYRDHDGNPDRRSLVAVRFPTWLQCPQCDRIAPSYRWSSDPGKASNYCPQCTANSPGQQQVHVIPVRFVMACEAGHLDEFPWNRWLDHNPNCKKNNNFLKLQSRGPGLSGLILSCPECKASKSMGGIFNVHNWKGLRCNGKRPWLRTDDEACDRQPRILQRGASNLYFPVLISALSIPPWSDRLQESLGMYWSDIVETKSEDRAQFIRILANKALKPILDELHVSPEELAELIEQRVNRYNDDSMHNLRYEEYRQFVSGLSKRPESDNEFEIRNVPVPDTLRPYFSNIVRVVRLREVKALMGFTRINPPGDENDLNMVPLSVQKNNWLPAIEVRGEGIFIAFDPDHLRQWESQKEVRERADKIQDSWLSEWRERYGEGDPSPVITPHYLLIHTCAHALIRQLTLECGYSSASLRERLYIAEDENQMSGLLIYTATSDSDGTLGGLQRQGKPEKISRTVRAAVKAMEWCSSDPLCIEGMVAAPENHSLAACHACCLASETSCEEFNRFLDRAMLVGLPEKSEIGYFSSMLQEE